MGVSFFLFFKVLVYIEAKTPHQSYLFTCYCILSAVTSFFSGFTTISVNINNKMKVSQHKEYVFTCLTWNIYLHFSLSSSAK